MANPDQKTILLEQAYDELKAICSKFQDQSGATLNANTVDLIAFVFSSVLVFNF